MKFNVTRISVLKIFDLDGVNDRSENALCTVSPYGSKIRGKYFPPISLSPIGRFDGVVSDLYVQTLRALVLKVWPDLANGAPRRHREVCESSADIAYYVSAPGL